MDKETVNFVGWGVVVPLFLPLAVLAIVLYRRTGGVDPKELLGTGNLLLYSATLSGKTYADWSGIEKPTSRLAWMSCGVILPLVIVVSAAGYTWAQTWEQAVPVFQAVVAVAVCILVGLTWVTHFAVRYIKTQGVPSSREEGVRNND